MPLIIFPSFLVVRSLSSDVLMEISDNVECHGIRGTWGFVEKCYNQKHMPGSQLAYPTLRDMAPTTPEGLWLTPVSNLGMPNLGMPHRDAIAKSASALEHDESEGRPSVEAVPDEVRAQIAAGQCVAIRGRCGYTRSEGRKPQKEVVSRCMATSKGTFALEPWKPEKQRGPHRQPPVFSSAAVC